MTTQVGVIDPKYAYGPVWRKTNPHREGVWAMSNGPQFNWAFA